MKDLIFKIKDGRYFFVFLILFFPFGNLWASILDISNISEKLYEDRKKESIASVITELNNEILKNPDNAYVYFTAELFIG